MLNTPQETDTVQQEYKYELWQIYTNISQESRTPIFSKEDRVKIFLRNVSTYPKPVQRHISEDDNFCSSLKI
jgi:hypothetical protein